MASGALPPPEKYIVGESWDDWIESFDDWSLATGKADKSEKVQVATLKTCIGGDAWKIFATFTFDDEDERAKIAPVKAKYRAYFEPQRNVTFERHKFRDIKQDQKGVDEWVTDLRRQAARCDYGALRNDVIRDQMIYGCTDEKCRERMLRDSDMTLESAIKVLKTAELTSLQFKTMGSGSTEKVQNIEEKRNEQWKDKRTEKPKKECRNCGYKHVLEKGKCPALDKECRVCGKKGHFASKCYKKNSSEREKERWEAENKSRFRRQFRF